MRHLSEEGRCSLVWEGSRWRRRVGGGWATRRLAKETAELTADQRARIEKNRLRALEIRQQHAFYEELGFSEMGGLK